ncbi:hypothetical protein J7T55_009879 [Diaporthe amygdali]|uniref:uncharacterized protein n=1 Tax=Phomopsis amygdali TaxID=1214568 RepID=UPI0022FF18B0|nr:uncharacterized protein J7T55_009879 [Diaporthe amygdali]KAJ0116729.1 hypothetical protein J7T55_009879 [Diaporthe amygdali]
MQLSTGVYFISTIATNPWGERWVQRNEVEDKTLLPKPVAIQVEEAGAAEWFVEQIDDNNFKLSAGSICADPAGTINNDGKLYADLTGAAAQNWTVTECQTCEEGVFIITDSNDHGVTWQTPAIVGGDSQILLDTLIIPLIYPPKYPPAAQFKFAAVGDVD